MRRRTPAKTGQTRARVGARGRRPPRFLLWQYSRRPQPRFRPRGAQDSSATGSPESRPGLRLWSKKNWEPHGQPGPRVPSRARQGDRGVGARAPASAAVTPSSPRAPRTPTQPPLTVDVPESQLIAQLREGLHGLQTAQLAVLIHRPVRRRVPREVQLRERRRRYRRHRP